jgi:non-haem Fe2+, alpha-ketoglutarate-dependent halogenase
MIVLAFIAGGTHFTGNQVAGHLPAERIGNMTQVNAAEISATYREKGFFAPIRVMEANEAESYRLRLERASSVEPQLAQDILKMKSHLVFGCLNELVSQPRILDAVEALIGPDILCWTSSMFSKAPRSPSFVSWHQDITYWGLDPPTVVTAWIALTESTPENGCMRVVPGTHLSEVMAHRDTYAADNMLSRGQEVAVQVDEADAVDLVLQPGEMSLHHAKIVHGSRANPSPRPRIGFAIRYMPASVRQAAGAVDSALLVRGEDRYHHFLEDPQPKADFDRDALAAHKAACERSRQFLFRKTAS